MAKMTVDTKILPIKADSIDVVPTGDLGDVVRETLIEVLDSDPRDNESYVDYIKRQAKAKADEMNVIKVALGLNTKEMEKINKTLEESTIDNYAAYLMSVLQGLTTGSYKEFMESQQDDEAETDPKSEEDED
ncbi:phage tail tube assembly chaperone [Lactobacillus amylovorus]|uniref:phage tail tube assembly chaperone n=1 Tax=Lactobacillus amylovorus TaxID=1604 RepID=UPI0022432421|nr:phage tail tube assembly chaperone [Lactobacillus amylovorus]